MARNNRTYNPDNRKEVIAGIENTLQAAASFIYGMVDDDEMEGKSYPDEFPDIPDETMRNLQIKSKDQEITVSFYHPKSKRSYYTFIDLSKINEQYQKNIEYEFDKIHEQLEIDGVPNIYYNPKDLEESYLHGLKSKGTDTKICDFVESCICSDIRKLMSEGELAGMIESICWIVSDNINGQIYSEWNKYKKEHMQKLVV